MTRHLTPPRSARGFAAASPRRALVILLALVAVTAGLAVAAVPAEAAGLCTRSARAAFRACGFEFKDDYWTAVAICHNEPTPEERGDCIDEAIEVRIEAKEECDEVYEARLELCDALGEAPYDPDFDPDDFETDFHDLTVLSPWFPLTPGNHWAYEGGDEEITIDVLDKTKLIEGVTCIVVNDVVLDEGNLVEDTFDWYAQALNGDLHYCGELARDFETFEGDDPEEAELVEIGGSFKAGRDGAKPGLLAPFAPVVGSTYRQEFALGDAEDAVEVISTTYAYGDDPELDAHVPEELADLLCDGDCLVTRDFTPLDPGAEEFKYYAPGIGLFLEVDPESGDILQLVECNVDPICDDLPEAE